MIVGHSRDVVLGNPRLNKEPFLNAKGTKKKRKIHALSLLFFSNCQSGRAELNFKQLCFTGPYLSLTLSKVQGIKAVNAPLKYCPEE